MVNTKQKHLFIDGENVRKSLSKILDNKEDFLNFNVKQIFAVDNLSFDKVFWYGAKISEDKNNLTKSKELLDFQRKLFNVLRKQSIEIDLSGRIQNIGSIYKEKGVDVALAVDLVSLAFESKDTEVYLWSSDSDLIPAIKKIVNKGVKTTYVALDGVITKSILFNTDSVIILKRDNLIEIFKNKNTGGTSQAGAGM